MFNTAMRNAVTGGASVSRPKAVGNHGARWLIAGLLAAAAPGVWAQQSPAPAAPAREVPQPGDLEPGVNTSATPPPAPAVPPGSSSTSAGDSASGAGNAEGATPNTAAPGPKDAAKSAARGKTTPPGKGVAQDKNGIPAAGPQSSPDPKAPKSGAKAQDRLQLDATQITGNQELPKVLYIVPWKRSDLGDLIGKPVNSLLDEVLEPVDRDVFKRENRYYDALKPDAATAAPAAGGQGSSDKH
jgi:hypothetical protein